MKASTASIENQEILDNFDFYHSSFPLLSPAVLQSIRFILQGVSLWVFYFALCILEPLSHFVYFTNWGLHLANISIGLSLVAGHYQGSMGLRKAAGVFQELAFISQLTIVCIYWTVLHKVVIDV